jgi:hypothetical protein
MKKMWAVQTALLILSMLCYYTWSVPTHLQDIARFRVDYASHAHYLASLPADVAPSYREGIKGDTIAKKIQRRIDRLLFDPLLGSGILWWWFVYFQEEWVHKRELSRPSWPIHFLLLLPILLLVELIPRVILFFVLRGLS